MMIKQSAMLAVASSALLLSGCMTIEEPYERPDAPIPAALPVTDATGEAVDPLLWQDVFTAPKLRELVELALDENRDLRIAAANVQLARAQYGVSRAQRLPTVRANGSATAGDTFDNGTAGGAGMAVAR